MTSEEKVARTRELIQSWASQQGHDRCWYYPDLFAQLCELHGVESPPPSLPPLEEFRLGCCMFQAREFGLEVDALKCGGKPTIPGTRFTVSQLLAELADGRSLGEISTDFELPLDACEDTLRFLASMVGDGRVAKTAREKAMRGYELLATDDIAQHIAGLRLLDEARKEDPGGMLRLEQEMEQH